MKLVRGIPALLFLTLPLSAQQSGTVTGERDL